MTAWGQRGDGARCRELGIAAYLTKPVDPVDVEAAVGEVLCGPAGTRDLVTTHSIAEQRARGRRILLAEDYPTNQVVAEKHLTRAGYKVFLAENGEEAVAIFRTKSVDLVLMDIQMPLMDGYAATREIRRIETGLSGGNKSPRTPIVAMTAHAMEGDREKCLENDMDDYIAKPMKRDLLIQMVRKWTERGEAVAHGDSGTGGSKDDSPMDMEKALAEFDHDAAFLKEVAEGFTADVRIQLGTIRAAIDAGEAGGVEKEAHAIKGGAANLTADELSRAALALECAARSGDLSRGRMLLDDLSQAFDRFVSQARTIDAATPDLD